MKNRWQTILPSIVIILLVMSGMFFYVQRPACMATSGCVGGAIWIAAGLLILLITLTTRQALETLMRPIRSLTQVIKTIQQGQMQTRFAGSDQPEVEELAQSFNTMTGMLAQQLNTLSEERHQLETVLIHMSDGAIIVDSDGYVLLNNPATNRILNIPNREIVGRSLAEVVRHHQLIALWQRCQRTGEEQTAAVEIGRELFLQAVITPFPEQNGYLMMLHDLTQVHVLQTVRRDFISNVSHELRTPLASLRAVVETLQDGAVDHPDVARRFLGRAEVEVSTLTQMVEELLELSRIESGQVPLKLEKTAVSSLVLIPLDRVRHMAQRENIALILDLPARLPHVLADAGRVQQVVTNLLHNAVKFTLENGRITITATVKKKENAVHIQVTDTGAGIPEEDLPRIFERFYKSDRARTRGAGGTGLGLAIARHIIQAHNGRIWAESEEGKGSTFYFSLPIHKT
ncbi:MAG: ATP-binding protein [Chloroflexota bacterium]